MILIRPKDGETRARLMNRTGYEAYRVGAYRVMVIGNEPMVLFSMGDVVDDATRAHLLEEGARIHRRSVQSHYDQMTESGAYFSLVLAQHEVMEAIEA